MRSISAVLACVFLFAASVAFADSRVFIIANQADGYGVDQSYRRVDPDEITGSVPKAGENCNRAGCNEYVAITCQR
jgi:hypothetical protein